MEIGTILDQIDLGAYALPEFQRGYVWNGNQVRELMNSLYRRYPVGGLLVWLTKTEEAEARGDQRLSAGNVRLILDGQQRVTSLYGIIKGRPPDFFQGNAKAFTDLYFHMGDESFEFYGPVKMRDDPYWVSVTNLMQEGLSPFIRLIGDTHELKGRMPELIERLNQLRSIRDVNLHIEEVTGPDKTVDVVVDIFNRVNSGGTKLSKGDLALARVCAEWPDARRELRAILADWDKAGFEFKMDWLLRNVNVVTTGEALFTGLKDVGPEEFQQGLKQTHRAVNYLLNIISGRLGLDHDRVLGGRYAFPIMCRWLVQNGGHFDGWKDRDMLLYWYVHTFIWGRFTGSTESVLNQDLAVMEDHEGALERLIEQLRLSRGDLRIRPENFSGWSRGARFYPLLYLLTRVGSARDWGSGLPLRADLLGKINRLQLHHIFPKSQLYKCDYRLSEVNALANFCFLTQDTNLQIGNRLPEEYFPEVNRAHPGALASQWVPMDPELWRPENYLEFLAARQRLLAEAGNSFLDDLLAGAAPEMLVPLPEEADEVILAVPGGIADEEEEARVMAVGQWVEEQGLPAGELLYELSDEDSGDLLAVLDLAWPDGIQTGLSEPVALLIDEERETLETASAAGYRCFTDVDEFKEYVREGFLALEVV
jgi:hypothetical protein